MTDPYTTLIEKMNKVKQKITDKYRGKDKFPIGTRRPIQEYIAHGMEDIPEDEIYFFKLDTTAPDNATSICLIGQAGCQKTTLIKTLTYYNSLLPNTKIGIFNLKGGAEDWEKCNRPHKNPGALYDDPAVMPIVAGCPLFALRGLSESDKKKTLKMNLPLAKLANDNVLIGLGFSPMSRQHAKKLLQSGIPIEKLKDEIEKMRRTNKMPKPAYDNMSILVDNMERAGFLAKKDFFDINEIWDSGKSWCIGFNNKEIPFLSVYVDEILTEVADRADSPKGKKERYWMVVDDAYKAFGISDDVMKYPSVQTGIDSLVLWRSRGINMILSAQSPVLLSEHMYDDIKHFFIYRTAQVDVLSKYIPNRSIIERIKRLNFQPDKHISQCIHVLPDRQRAYTFFPFNSPINNS